ncbi:4-hydroxy-3-methylbut-2-enyl diphosphate reductase [Desulfoplanes formicivorans]|uniref:4-hydroxy-3-methylbut-2-enyl diphosphate reductase n=1 Tax=Desulfoplanes formicivorans TaxID=1592317 RepID=A0A194AJ11_9BACT|nr:4-hydroxy-3-methylbut-2-enyl diphosphate reductase [Desulfoplanes formicivorans]GAU09056.1 4-hydroxy-3-methylbut-2-enyl diphosphate reductase [Desulfoplanes formicivorans]
MKTIHLAQTAGFCMGVALALKKLDQALAGKKAHQHIVTQGPIIHNPQVLKYYQAKGVFECQSLDELNARTVVVIRAHGIPLDMQHAIQATGATLVDATCPKVKKAQILIGKNSEQGRHLLLFGEKEHPEVKGLVSYAQNGFTVFESLQELETILPHIAQPCFLAAQTTQDREEFKTIQARLTNILGDIPVMDTICTATKERQQEAIAIARQVDFMIVVGGKNSGNTRRLAQVAAATHTPCCHVECREEIPVKDLVSCRTIGLTAGASTPQHVINDIVMYVRQLQA